MRFVFVIWFTVPNLLLAQEPTILDRLDPRTIPASRKVENAPPELVGVLGEPHAVLDDSHFWFTPTFSKNGKAVAVSRRDGEVLVVDLSGKEPVEEVIRFGKNKRFVFALDFAPDGKRLALGSTSFGIVDLMRQPRQPAEMAKGYEGMVTCLVCAPDGKTVAAGCFDAVVRLYDVTGAQPQEKAKLPAPVPEPKADRILSLSYASDGKTLAVGHFREKVIHVWDVSKDQPTERMALKPQKDAIRAVQFHTDGKKLFAAGLYDPFIRAWDIETGKPDALSFEKHPSLHTHRLSLSPDGKTLAASDHEGRIFLHDVASGKITQQWQIRGCQGLAFAPDGRHLAVGHYTGVIYILRCPRG